MRLDDHSTVREVRGNPVRPPEPVVAAERLRELAFRAGADDVGFVPVDTPGLEVDVEHARTALPGARTYVAFCVRMNRDNVRSPLRSIANTEFHQALGDADEVGHRLARLLQDEGHRVVHPASAFPQEMDDFPGRGWVISHKLVAQAAGLGRIGIHRNVIHPRFGNFILLGTVVVDFAVDEPSGPVDFNPCLECKLCVAACPVGAIGKEGSFDFAACYTHNYREFMSGFTDWVETVADSADRADYRSRVSPAETASMWQSLAFKPNYKAAYCVAACPAGSDVIGPFLADRKGFVAEVVKPLQDKEEPVYVVPGSPAEEHVRKRFPHKRVRRVSNGL
ncbi:(4Fe-4S)-binding protein [Actinosynnema sp. NPDC047251]|uniref:4Fe-4S ferredoxin iron-sulfur binding domain-containing protein n=1 Tax=Saccharothrix espanaensis (strain ATCC 51144 / DSM 44229 / JCM 9112 / NBRC 15066 / NRRL 15764) TaxID=1179773 RepID=K0KBN8_SACES|nr:4Fe-4S ferredoxin iron-sulfur-binding domain-containing protein [Saccharothrix espanaensis]CCH34244.1 4Fe-4S ferredoxin iron-sulfur binding domain-containing protein [Saccharothrix espanaensis DSM 44229]